MARFVEPERLWPLLAFFAGAVVLLVGTNTVMDAMDAPSNTRWIVVLCWMVLVPLGAWTVWKRTDPRRRG